MEDILDEIWTKFEEQIKNKRKTCRNKSLKIIVFFIIIYFVLRVDLLRLLYACLVLPTALEARVPAGNNSEGEGTTKQLTTKTTLPSMTTRQKQQQPRKGTTQAYENDDLGRVQDR